MRSTFKVLFYVKKGSEKPNGNLKESIGYLEEEKQEVYEKVRDMQNRKDELREKFLNMHEYTQQKEEEISDLENRIAQLKYKAQDDINLLFEIFPNLSERLLIAQLCKGVRLAMDTLKQLFKGEAVPVTGISILPNKINLSMCGYQITTI